MKITFSLRSRGASGFSLLELLVAITIFAVVGGATLRLFSKHMPLFNTQANQSQLTFNLRTAVAQIEMDTVNAGSGYYQAVDIPDWPIGITIANSTPGTDCHNAGNYTYGPNCFDQLNVISFDPNTPPSHPSGDKTGMSNADTSLGAAFLVPTGATSAATLATNFRKGDEILFIHALTSGNLITTVVLSANGVATLNGTVQLAFQPTGPSSTLPAGANSSTFGDPNYDPLLISNAPDSSKLTNIFTSPNFGGTNDWVLRLSPVIYLFDGSASCVTFACPAADPNNPKLLRISGNGTLHPNSLQDKHIDVLAEQIIGFKIGIVARNGSTDLPITFNVAGKWPQSVDTNNTTGNCTSNCGINSDWSQVRSVRVSLIGRTPPNSDPANKFNNKFDNGPYKIEGASITINPRNLSMTD